MDLLEGLNAEQQRAVQHDTGPLLILAGAGSGKTKTLTHRIAYVIQQQNVWPDQILAVTFTNKAAREMRERLWRLLEPSRAAMSGDLFGQANSDEQAPPRSFMPWMGTFHGICVRLLRIDGQAIGISPSFVIYDEDDRLSLIKQAMKELNITDKQVKPRAVSGMISSAKNKLQTPEDMLVSASYPFERQVAELYESYERMRQKAEALDFDDLLIEVVRLFRDVPEVRAKWKAKFKHILIDEYQDTNAAQYAIVKQMVGDERNICVVGDDWQSIYSWRGADFTNILNFERDFSGATVVKLEQNYRSTGSILEAAQNVINKNTQRSDKVLWTASEQGVPVQVHAAYDEAEEASMVADRIVAQESIGARQYKDFAVLYRTNAQSAGIERAMRLRRIPYQLVGGVRFYDRKEIKDVIAYLKVAYQPNDRVSFGRIVNTPTRGIGATSVERFFAWQATTDMDIVTALANVGEATTVPARARTLLGKLGELFRHLQAEYQAGTTPAGCIELILNRTGYRDFVNDGTPQAEDRLANLDALLTEAQLFAETSEFLEEVALVSSVDQASDGNAVTLMTMHAAKGLEYPVVFMVGMEEGILPHARVYESGPSELEEERRLCYVGMTRAREELHLSYAHSRLQYNQRNYNTVSRFIADMGDAVATISEDPGVHNEPVDDFYSDELAIDIGDRVRSAAFGVGEVVEVDGLAVTIRFEKGITKKLNAEYARLEKIG